MSNSSIQDQNLEVTVVGCTHLAQTQWINKQNPYVCLEYGGQRCRTRACPDGDKNPSFHQKFLFKLIEGIREITVNIRNKNVIAHDNFIASGSCTVKEPDDEFFLILLGRVISDGYDDTPWPLLTKSGRHAGDVKVILYYENAQKDKKKPEENPTLPPPPVIYQPLPPPVIYQPPPPPVIYQPPPPPVYQPPSQPYVYPSTPPHPASSCTTTQLPHSYYCHTCGIFIYETSDYHLHRGHHLHQGYQQESSEWCGSTSHQPPLADPRPPQPSYNRGESFEPSAPTEPSEHHQNYPRHYPY